MREQMVGRAGAVVPDPLNEYLELLGDYAQEVDDLATDLGQSLAALNEHQFRELFAEVNSTRESEPNRKGVELARAWHAPTEHAEQALARATEELLLLEGMSAATPAGRAELEQAIADARVKQRDADRDAIRAYGVYETAGLSLDPDGNVDHGGYDVVSDEQNYVHDWFEHNGSAFAVKIGVLREGAVRDRLGEIGRSASDPAPAAGTPFKEVGTDGPALLAQRRLVEAGWSPELERAGTRFRVTRDSVDKPPLLEPAFDALGSDPKAQLEEQIRPFEEWVAQHSDWEVRERHSQLGTPSRSAAHLRAAAGYRIRRLERASAVLGAEVATAHDNAGQWADRDPEASAVQTGTADDAQARLDFMEAELGELRERLLTEERELRAQRIWTREHEIRCRMDVAHGVECSLQQGSRDLADQLGTPPERGSLGYEAWENVARDFETQRLSEVSARLEGLEAPERDPELSERVAQYRRQTGVEVATEVSAPALEAPGNG